MFAMVSIIGNGPAQKAGLFFVWEVKEYRLGYCLPR